MVMNDSGKNGDVFAFGSSSQREVRMAGSTVRSDAIRHFFVKSGTKRRPLIDTGECYKHHTIVSSRIGHTQLSSALNFSRQNRRASTRSVSKVRSSTCEHGRFPQSPFSLHRLYPL